MSQYELPTVYAAPHPDVDGPVAQAIEWHDGRVAVRKLTPPETTLILEDTEAAEAHVPIELLEAGHVPEEHLPELWRLYRQKDVSGMSGEGYVAEGVEWADGAVAYRWRSNPCTTQLADEIEHVRTIHGHSGNSQVRWVDR